MGSNTGSFTKANVSTEAITLPMHEVDLVRYNKALKDYRASIISLYWILQAQVPLPILALVDKQIATCNRHDSISPRENLQIINSTRLLIRAALIALGSLFHKMVRDGELRIYTNAVCNTITACIQLSIPVPSGDEIYNEEVSALIAASSGDMRIQILQREYLNSSAHN